MGDADIAVEPLKDFFCEMRSVPTRHGLPEPLAELRKGRLGDQGQAHLPVADMEVEGAGPLPPERLMDAEELFDVPALGVIAG